MEARLSTPTKRKKGGPKAQWTPQTTTAFCELRVQVIKAGHRPTSFITREGWQIVATKFLEAYDKPFTIQQLKSKWTQQKEEYRDWKTLMHNDTSIAFNSATGNFDASDEWWELKIQSHPSAVRFRKEPLQNGELLAIMFDKHIESHLHGWTPQSTTTCDSSSPSCEPIHATNFQDHPLMDDDALLEATLGCNKTFSAGKKRKQPMSTETAVCESATRKKKGKGKQDGMYEDMHMIATAFQQLSDINNKASSPFVLPEIPSIKECLEMVSKTPGVDDNPPYNMEFYVITASKLFLKKVYRETFVGLPESVRLGWLRDYAARGKTAD